MSFEVFSNVVVYLKSEMDALLAGYTGTAHVHDGTSGDGPKLAQANTHESPDTDAGASSLHHTIGSGAAQAAAGDHGHTGRCAFPVNLANATIGSGATNYICPSTGAINTTNWKADIVFPFGVTLKNLRVYTAGAQPASGSLVFTLWDDSLGQSTGITVTFAAGAGQGAQTDSTHTYALGQGQGISLKVVNNAASASAPIAQIYLEYDV